MDQIFTAAFLVPLFTAGVRMGAPLIFGSVGDVLSEKTGVMNIALEGEMLIAALISFMAAYSSGSLFVGVLAGGFAGLLSALVIAFWGISRRQDQSVVGIMFNIFALGFTNFLYRATFGVRTDRASIATLPEIRIPLLADIPYIGEILFAHNILVYLAILSAVAVWFVMKYTKFGLKAAAAGENPKAAAAAGVDVARLRYAGYMFSGFMAGIGGAFLSLGNVGTFTENMTSGRGFICLAITILSRWNPLFAVLAALLFGTVEALQLRLQAMGAELPYQFFVALPYIVTLISLVIFGRNIRAPKDLGNAYEKESR